MSSRMMIPWTPRDYTRSPRLHTPRMNDNDSIAVPIPAALLSGEKSDMDPAEVLAAQRTITLLKEYEYTQHLVPQGLYVVPSWEDLSVWHGVVFIRQGFYNKGIFRFKIQIPENYPAEAPNVIFTQQVHHPLVDPETGKLDLKPEFPEWSPEHNLLFVLIFIKRIFFNKKVFVSTDSPPDQACYDQFMNNKRLFLEEAERVAEESCQKIHNCEDDCSLQFPETTEGKKHKHKCIRQRIGDLAKYRQPLPQAKDTLLQWLDKEYIPSAFASPQENAVSESEQDASESQADLNKVDQDLCTSAR